MGFWTLFKFLLLSILSPKVGWKKLDKYSIPNNIIQSKLLYPCLSILAMSVFVPYVCGYGNNDKALNEMIMYALIEFVKYFIGFFVVSNALSSWFSFTTKTTDNVNRLNNYISINLTILAIINIMKNLTPGFPLFDFCPLFVIYVIYTGMKYVGVDDEYRGKFVVASSLLLLLVPIGIKFVFELMIPNLN